MQSKATAKHTENNILDSTGTKYLNLEISRRLMREAEGRAHELFSNLSIELFRFLGIVQECIFLNFGFLGFNGLSRVVRTSYLYYYS